MQGRSTSTYEFGRFRLDVTERRLLCDGQALPLTPKVFDVLQVLVENSGHLVEKDKLLADVWPNSFVEDGALSRSISILRKTLAEGDPELAYIETLPTRGYRSSRRSTSVVDGSDTPSGGPTVETLRADHPAPASPGGWRVPPGRCSSSRSCTRCSREPGERHMPLERPRRCTGK
jgi:DNA-binding winged helix-turn-helix (wHTH) protein